MPNPTSNLFDITHTIWSSSFILRIVASAWLVCGPVWFGIFCRGHWIVKFLAAVFTVSFALGRWRSWALSWRKGMILPALLGQVVTYFFQWILCTILFWFGQGINKFLLENSKSNDDDINLLLLVWSAVSLVLGAILIVVESRTGAVHGIQSGFFVGKKMEEEGDEESPIL